MKIINKALTKDKYKHLYEVMNSTDFPWYYSDSSVDGDNISYFSHLFMKFGKSNSDFTYLVEPFYSLMKPSKLLHIRANLTVSKTKVFKTPFHTDYHEQDPKHRTAIFYLNDNNGYTEFKKPKKIIKSEANKFIIFKNTKHRAVTQNDTDKRIVINFNYFTDAKI